ncbi:MAG: LpxL/LpxP family acyltransferase, partial [Planctomycetota bacterium]
MEETREIERLMELKRRRRARRRPWVKLKKHAVYFCTINIVRFLDSLSRPAMLKLGELLSWIFIILPNPHFKRAIRHLGYAFPDKSAAEMKRLACKTFINLGRTMAEVIALPRARGNFSHLARKDASAE